MKIKIHEKAVQHFNSKINEFLFELKPDVNIRKQQKITESSAAHTFISEHLTEKDIIEISSTGYVDQLSGQQVERYFNTDKNLIGLEKESYSNFLKSVERLYEREEINKFLSLDFIIDCAFDWFEKKYKGMLGKDDYFIEFMIDESEKVIKKYKVSIPISFMAIQKSFIIGNTTFEYFRTDFYDKYINEAKTKMQESGEFNSDNFKIFERNFRRTYQGAVFASINLEAEKQRCIEIAISETENALMILRFFSPSVFLPQIPCYFGIMGQRNLPSNHAFIFEKEMPEIQEGILEKRHFRLDISQNKFEELKHLGIDIASNLIIKTNPTEFESLILNSISLFGRALTSDNFQDKVVYALVSIETLLLQDNSEPIQSNIGLRLAFLTEFNQEKRKKVKSLINDAYKIRSSYIHHGTVGEDWKLLETLQHIIWTALRNTLIMKDKFKSQKEFLDYIEKIILS